MVGQPASLLDAPQLVDLRTPVEVSVPAGMQFGPVQGIRIRRVGLPLADVADVGGFRVTTGPHTALDIARWEPLMEAVPALDVLLARVVVGQGELIEAAAELGSGPGMVRARRAVGLADGRAESPPESRLRVLLALAGLAAVPQFTVRDARGGFVARVDLAFPGLQVAIEYDGAWHAEPGRFAKDRRRLNALVAAGWTVLHVTAADLRDPAALMARVSELLFTARASVGMSGSAAPTGAPLPHRRAARRSGAGK